jgi:hypothetical protein
MLNVEGDEITGGLEPAECFIDDGKMLSCGLNVELTRVADD